MNLSFFFEAATETEANEQDRNREHNRRWQGIREQGIRKIKNNTNTIRNCMLILLVTQNFKKWLCNPCPALLSDF